MAKVLRQSLLTQTNQDLYSGAIFPEEHGWIKEVGYIKIKMENGSPLRKEEEREIGCLVNNLYDMLQTTHWVCYRCHFLKERLP